MKSSSVAIVIIVLLIAALGLVFFFSSDAETEQFEFLKVVECYGGESCDVSEYDSDQVTGAATLPAQGKSAHTIGKGQSGIVVISDTTRNKEVDGVAFQIRYAGTPGISGDMQISFMDDALEEEYCSLNIPLSDRLTSLEVDISDECDWTKEKLDDLTIRFTNSDISRPNDLYIRQTLIRVDYSR